MNHYYDAYDKRYQIIHKKGCSWSSDIPTPIVLNTLQKYSVSKDSFILEIGCGEGRDAFRLLDEGYNVMASDISSEAINYCRCLRLEYSDHFSVLDCINNHHEFNYDFIYSVAVIHMLVDDNDRNAFYRFIHDHLNDNGLALICSMGDGIKESVSDISKAFDMVERNHESGFVKVPSTSLRMVSFDAFENEIISNNLSIIEKGITPSLPDFNHLMYAVVKNMNNYTSRNRHKYYLKAYLIFVCKYRKQLLTDDIDKALKSCFYEVSENSRFNIEIMESDKDNIHLLVSYSPNISITSIVRILKQKSTHQLWDVYPSFLKIIFGKNTHSGVMVILSVLLVRPTQILLESILKTKDDGIHPID